MSDSTVNIADRAKRIRSPKFGEIAQVRDLIAGQENVVNLGYGEPGFATPKHSRDAAKIKILVNPLMPSRLQACCWPRRSFQSP